jgi:hypothetical protein
MIRILFDVSSLPDQTVTVYLQNIATGRINSIETESIDGSIELNLNDYDFTLVNNQTYKIVIKDESGTVVEFDYEDESYNCMNLTVNPAYVATKIPSPVY